MTSHWEDHEKVRAGVGPAGKMGHVCWFLGVLFALLGVIADAANTSVGLEAISWLLLSIIAFLASVTFFISWGVAWYLRSIEDKNK